MESILSDNSFCVMWYVKVAIALFAMAIASLLLFGPIAAFHHQVAYGLFGYMFSGSEDADPGDFVLFGERFWFFPFRFAISVAVWLGLLAITLFVIRPFAPNKSLHPIAATSSVMDSQSVGR